MTATTTATAIIPAPELTALDRFDALALRVGAAEEESTFRRFDYRDRLENKEARGWVYRLRQIKGDIERHRKDAKAVHLERGRAVDEKAKLLEAAVQGLIEPHQAAIDQIEAEEQARIDGHKAVLDRIAALADGATTSEEAQARLDELATVDATALEEFATAGANRLADAIEGLLEQRDALQQQEAERAELEALRAEKAAREEAERIERIRQEAIEAERREAAEAAQRAEERRVREAAEADRRQQDAIAAAEAARQAQARAEQREREALAAAEAARQAEADRKAAEALRQQQAEQARTRRVEAFRSELKAAMKGRTGPAVVEAIIAGSLHPAITIDWSKA